ncbi:MAG: polymorphic toxin type 44 domain-containing protein [Aulosira sp. ZfuCHP01]|nr:polymorphic toxin type 44 domain-containing protein [Aulosira sp. ZfuCHP01]
MPLDNAGNILNTALNVNLNSNSQSFSDWIGVDDTNDYYGLNLSGRSSLNLALTNLSANVNIDLLNSSGGLIARSENANSIAESINSILDAGSYYIRVYQGATNSGTNYNLSVAVQNNSQPNLVWRNSATGENALWQMNGDSLLNGAYFNQLADNNWKIEGTADFNRDGQLDIVWRNSATGQNALWYMNGTTLLGTAYFNQLADTNWKIVGTADFNRDGQPDIVWRNSATGENALWYMNNATLLGGVYFNKLADNNWKIEGTADFNRDGQSDIVWRNSVTGENALWYMNGTTLLSGVYFNKLADNNWKIEGTADFNRDGQPDIVWRNSVTGQNALWYMNGTTLLSGVYFNQLGDTNWKIAGIGSRFNEPTAIDLAGNTTANSFNTGTINGNGTFRDRVDATDSNDYYRFNVATTSDFTLSLNGLSADANVQLLDSNGAFIQGSTNTGTTAESISRSLNAGNYYVRVYSLGGGTNYNLNLSAIPQDYAGNTFSTARNIGTLSSTQTFNDFVGDSDPNDYYKFSVNTPTNLNLSLNGLSNNADIRVLQDLNANGQSDAIEILTSSKLTGNASESINLPLGVGNYYIHVYPVGNSVNTNYNLSVSAASFGNYDYIDPSPVNNTYFGSSVTRSFFNSKGIGTYQSQFGTFLMYGAIADYYTNNQYANNNTTNGLFGVYSGLGLPTSPIYKKEDGSFVMEFEGGTLTNRNGIVTPSYNQKASSFALVGQGAPDGTELQWKNDYIYWSQNSVGNPTGSVRRVTGGWVQEFTASPKGDGDSIFFVRDGQQLTQGGPYRVQGWMLDIYRLTGGYERQNGGLGFPTQATEQSNVNGYKYYHTFENGFIGITADNKIAIKNWQGQLINVVGYDGVAINSTYRNTFNRDGSSSFLGSPINNVHSWGDGYIQDFSGGFDAKGGIMKSNANDNSYWVGGDFWNKFLQMGGAGGSLRYPTSDRYAADNGWRQQFQGGTIFKSADGSFSVLIVGNDGGATHSTYVNTFNRDGGTASLGSPINNVHPWGNGYIQDFTGGSDGKGGIMKSNANDNSYWVGGDFWNKFLEIGGAGSILGYPTSDRYSTNGSWRQDFQGGVIIQSSKGIFPAFGGIGAHYLNDEGGERGRLGSPTSGEIGVGNGVIHQYFDNGYIIYNDNGSTYTVIDNKASGLVRASFSGWVMPSIGVYLRNSPHLNDKTSQAKPYHETLYFDGWTTGDVVTDYSLGTPDNRWFKVAGTNYWVPSGYINGNPPTISVGGDYTGSSGTVSSDIVYVNFSGWVMPDIGVALRNSPHLNDKNGQAKPYHQTLSFDAWTTGDTVTDYQLGTPDNRWFRIAGTNEWVPSGYIYGNPPGSGYTNPGTSTPTNTGGTVDSEIILKNFSGWVMPGIGVALRNSPHLSDKNGQAKSYHETISFDAWTTGDTVIDYMAGTPDNRWFRIAGTNNWVPSGYIYGNPEGMPNDTNNGNSNNNSNDVLIRNPDNYDGGNSYISIASTSDARDGDNTVIIGDKITIRGQAKNVQNLRFYIGDTQITLGQIDFLDNDYYGTLTIPDNMNAGTYSVKIVANNNQGGYYESFGSGIKLLGSALPIENYIYSQMRDNRNNVDSISLLNSSSTDFLLSKIPGFTGLAKSLAYILWANKVAGGRDWDHKWKEEVRPDKHGQWTSDIDEYGIQRSYKFEMWSNIHYGYVGKFAGFSDWELIGGAGAAQILTNAKNNNIDLKSFAFNVVETITEFIKNPLNINNIFRVASLIDTVQKLIGGSNVNAVLIDPSSWDDPSDKKSVELGVQLYYNYGYDLSRDNFVGKLHQVNADKFYS